MRVLLMIDRVVDALSTDKTHIVNLINKLKNDVLARKAE